MVTKYLGLILPVIETGHHKGDKLSFLVYAGIDNNIESGAFFLYVVI